MAMMSRQDDPGNDPGADDRDPEADDRAPEKTETSETSEKSPKSEGIQSVERALTILETLAEAGDELTLSELVQEVKLRTEVSLSTVYRLLSVLVARGYVWQSGPRGRYAIGPRLPKLAAAAGTGTGRQSDLRREARPVLRKLSAQVQETTNLVELHGKRAIYVDQAFAERSVALFAQIGKRAPLYCTGAGKILLAYQSKSIVEAYLADAVLKQRTPFTLTKRDDLLAELERTRERGYAFDEGEFEEDVHCVAAAVFNQAGRVVAALSISAPASRCGIDRMTEELGSAVAQAARDLSRQLGYRP